MGFDLRAQLRNLSFKTLQPLGDRLKRELHLATLQAKRLQLLLCDLGLGEQPLGLAIQAGECGFGLCLLVACLRGALDELHRSPAVPLGLPLGYSYGAAGLPCLCLLAPPRLPAAGGPARGPLPAPSR